MCMHTSRCVHEYYILLRGDSDKSVGECGVWAAQRIDSTQLQNLNLDFILSPLNLRSIEFYLIFATSNSIFKTYIEEFTSFKYRDRYLFKFKKSV